MFSRNESSDTENIDNAGRICAVRCVYVCVCEREREDVHENIFVFHDPTHKHMKREDQKEQQHEIMRHEMIESEAK